MKLYTEQYLINYARKYSPYYRDLYKDLPKDLISIKQTPVVKQDEFWAANTHDENNRVLTGTIENGIAFKSGGSTNAPKFSIFGKEEYITFCEASGLALLYNGAQTGDRFANLFYGGQLYASFLYVHDLIRMCPVCLTEYPIMGSTSVEEMVHIILQHHTNALTGVPTTIIKLFEYVKNNNIDLSFVEKIYFGGESFFNDQRDFIHSINPHVQIRSIAYALVDGGISGYCDNTCGFNEHRDFNFVSILEIVDEYSGEVINEPNRSGNLVITSLYRLLQPMIRYPLGDKGMWIEPEGSPNRKFLLQGRSQECARIGPVSLYYDDMRPVMQAVPNVHVLNYQFIISHKDGKDKLTVRAATDETDLATQHVQAYRSALHNARPFFIEETEKGHIHETDFEFTTPESLQYNLRTGKIKRIIDERL
ncbi:MAG: hypothetical protein LBV52_06040 [Spirochaetaceae bacterium]|jgi:phenylacetate-CoA ligase|nr:hypothetical protein [Spirochaetaceae bacterium]